MLYKIRFKLLSSYVNIDDIDGYDYNSMNSKEEIPKLFYTINQQIFSNTNISNDLDKVIHICQWLNKHILGGPGLSEASEVALKMMLNGEGGVCSDFAQVFNNFCVINDIRVREWGITQIPFEPRYGGHSVNEFFSKELNKWILLDVYYCTYFVLRKNIPLSVVEVYKSIKEGRFLQPLCFNEANEEISLSIERNYFQENIVPFLICNYSNKIYDDRLRRLKAYLPIFVIHFSLFLQGKSYKYLFPFEDQKIT